MKKQTTQTKASLAGKLGITRQLLNHHLKNPLAPKDLGDIDAWTEFLLANGRDAGLPVEIRKKIAEQRFRLLKAQADKAEGEEAVRRGELITFAEVSAFLHGAIGGYWEGIDRMAHEMPPNLVGLSAAQMFMEFKREKEKIVKSTQEYVRKFVDGYEAKQKAAAKKEVK